jgi:hypothetical protein
MVDRILEVATNGLEWARKRESERLDQEHHCVEWWPSDKNDEGYLIAELAVKERMNTSRSPILAGE